MAPEFGAVVELAHPALGPGVSVERASEAHGEFQKSAPATAARRTRSASAT